MKRRQEARYPTPAGLTVEVHIMGDASLNILRARDISLSGLGVYVPHGFESADLNHELDLVITLPGSRSFTARGIVRHRNREQDPNFFGVEFTAIRPDNREKIEAFVHRLARPEAPAD